MILLREILFCNAKQVNWAMYRLLFAEADFSKASLKGTVICLGDTNKQDYMLTIWSMLWASVDYFPKR